MTDRIPQEDLDRAHRALCRRVASMLIAAMAEADGSYELLDKRLGKPAGFAKRYINSLIECGPKMKQLREVSDLTFALGCTPHITFYKPQAAQEQPE